jgi:HK97 family phage major capsid protein
MQVVKDYTLQNDASKALDSIREGFEKTAANVVNLDTELKGLAKKYEQEHKKVDEYEAVALDLQKKQIAIDEKAKATEQKLLDLESIIREPNLKNEKKEDLSNEMKAFEKLFINPEMSTVDRKYLRTDNNSQGGYLIPEDYILDIITKLEEKSVLRNLATKYRTGRDAIVIPKVNSNLEASWVGEGQEVPTTQPSFGSVRIPVNKMSVAVEISREMISDTPFKVEEYVRSEAIKAFARKEERAFVVGEGTNMAKGILESITQEINNGSTTAFNADSLFKLQAEIKEGYNPYFMFNKNTLYNYIRPLKGTSNDHYLLDGNITSGTPSTIAGLPYALSQDMPNVGADTMPIIIGDFKEAYYIVDHTTSGELVVDPTTKLTLSLIRYVFFRRVGGQLVLPEAVAGLRMSV